MSYLVGDVTHVEIRAGALINVLAVSGVTQLLATRTGAGVGAIDSLTGVLTGNTRCTSLN